MKKMVALIMVLILSMSLVGCSKKVTIDIPFDSANVSNIEMYHFTVPTSAEKKVITGADDIEAIYTMFVGLSLTDKKTEPVPGKSVTGFRFNLSDGTSYEIIYCAEAVKAGRLKFPAEQLDYFTLADIEGHWDNYDYEIVPADESELPSYE